MTGLAPIDTWATAAILAKALEYGTALLALGGPLFMVTLDGYVVEGHVPFETIRKVLSERPGVDGIAVPGMPYGSPGMGTDPNARYDVFVLTTTQVAMT